MRQIYNKEDDSYFYGSHADFDPKKHYWGEDDPNILYPPNVGKMRPIKEMIGGHSDGDENPSNLEWWCDPYLDNDGLVHCQMNRRAFNEGKVTSMRLGKFLLNVVGWTNQTKIKNFVDALKPSEIHIGKTAEEFRWVYDHSEANCDSCMSGKFESWKEHPVEIYATGQMSIYYTLDPTGQNVTNRVIVIHKDNRNIAIRFYGNATTWFQEELARNHNVHLHGSESDLYGVELRLVIHDRKRGLILMPYLDIVRGAHITADGKLRMGNGDSTKLHGISYTQEGVTQVSFVECSISNKRVPIWDVIRAMHPYGGAFRYFDKTQFKIDPWGYVDLRARSPEYYKNGYPAHFYARSKFCPVLNRRVYLYHFSNSPEFGIISYDAIVRYFRRDFITGKLIPKNETVVDEYERSHAISSLVPDTSEKDLLYPFSDHSLAIRDDFMPSPVSARGSNIPVYVKVSDVLIRDEWVRDEITGEMIAKESSYALENGTRTQKTHAETGERLTFPGVMNDEDFDPAAWGIDPDAASEKKEREEAEERSDRNGLSLSEILGLTARAA